MKTISFVMGCYNEKDNIPILYEKIKKEMDAFSQYDYEIICIDNFSTDGTREVLRNICAKDRRFKAIFNVRNFGHIKSPWHAFLLAKGDAVVGMCSDLEDPPELIPQMIYKWEEGYKIALAVRTSTEEKGIMPFFRSTYYWLMKKISTVDQLTGFTGYGIYDKEVMDVFRSLDEPYPYTRGLICELGWSKALIPFHKKYRKHGKSKGNIFVYMDMALLGIVNQSRLPLRLATITGVVVSGISFLVALYYGIFKITHWDSFQAGIAPLMCGLFFLMGLVFLFLGLMGEYIGLIVTHVVKRPLVIEEERINFEDSTNTLSNSFNEQDKSDAA